MCTLMRHEFYPIMQCLEHGDDMLSKTYCVELALTLARLDASLREEERRVFVCAFDSLVAHLLRRLARAAEAAALLRQSERLLTELAGHCRAAEDSSDDGDSAALRHVSSAIGVNEMCGAALPSAQSVTGANHSRSATSQTLWQCEEFIKFCEGEIPCADANALVDVLHRRHRSEKHNKNSKGGNSNAENPPITKELSTSSAVNATAVRLSVVCDALLYGRLSIAPSRSSSPGSVEETEAQNEVEALSQHSHQQQQKQLRGTTQEVIGRITIPTPSALTLLVTLFPSLHNCAVYFTRFAAPVRSIFEGIAAGVTTGLMKSMEGLLTESAPESTTDVTASRIRPTDVLLYALLNSLTKTREGTSKEEKGKKEEEEEDAPVECTEDIVLRSVPRRVGAELDIMIEAVQSAIANAQSIKEQISTELTLLIFRVVSTTIDFLIPAVYYVEQRAFIFYRKWICDIYRLLLEEGLLERFNTLLDTTFPQQETQSQSQLQSQGHSQCQTQTPSPSQESRRPLNASTRRSAGNPQRVGVSKSTTRHAPPQQQAKLPCGGRTVSTSGARDLSQESANASEFREDYAGAWIAPGTAYARHARCHAGECASHNVSQSQPERLLDTKATRNALPERRHSFGFFDDPAVQLAEGLLEYGATDAAVPQGYVLTRLMAALLRGLSSDKLRRAAETSVKRAGNNNNNNSGNSTATQQTPTATPTLTHRKRKWENSPLTSALLALGGKRQATPASTPAEAPALSDHPSRFPFPSVSGAEDIRALYGSALLDAEIGLSPLDPIRASLVHNAVNFLAVVVMDLRAAYDILDAYLEDVAVEKIQHVVKRRVPLDIPVESERESSAPAAESSFTVTTVRRARAMPSDPPHTNEVKGLGSQATARRGASAPAAEKEMSAGRWSLVPVVIPSWNSQEEREQFMEIAALLKREHMALRDALAAAAPVISETEARRANV